MVLKSRRKETRDDHRRTSGNDDDESIYTPANHSRWENIPIVNTCEAIAKLISDNGENPHSLSAKVRIPQPTIYRMVIGQTAEPKRANVEKIAKFFNVSADALCRGEIVPIDQRSGLINSSINDPVREAAIQDPAAEYLAKLPPHIADKLRLDIKHAYERWEMEQKDTGYSAEWIQTGEGDPKLSQLTDKLNTLSARLIEARTDKGWNKTELKKAAGLKSASTLTDLESGARTQSPQLPLIADALGVEVLWLQHGKGQKKRGLINASRSDYTEPVPSSAHDPILDTLEKMPECLRNKIRILARHALEAWQLEQIATGVGISSADLLTDSLAMDKSKLGYDLGRVDLRTSTLIGRLVEDFFRSSSANRHRILQLASECATKG